ncbi:MAG TPA: phage head closure protein [Sphingobium sp.]|uniref:phage head closure protein n=1 Tax=Sphingobium sp. TaxID=1912891 RepID=UPI002ED4006C
MSSSKYNRRISIEMPVRVANGKGGFTKGWSAPVPVWAEMIPLRGHEAVEHNLLKSEQLWRVTIRHRDDITPECRITYRGRPMNIRTSEDPDGRGRELVMTCESGVKV